MNFSYLNEYLVARFMFWYAATRVPGGFTSLFQRSGYYHNHETRSADHFHIPVRVVTSDLGKPGIRPHGAIIWNTVLSNNINIDVSERLYVNSFKKSLIIENVFTWIDGRIIIMYTWSQCNCVIIISNKYVDHISMSISLVKTYLYYGMDLIVSS